VNLRSKKL